MLKTASPTATATVAKSVLDSIVATTIATATGDQGTCESSPAAGVIVTATTQYSPSSSASTCPLDTLTIAASTAEATVTSSPPHRAVSQQSAGKLDRLLEKLASAARREFDHDRNRSTGPAKSLSSSTFSSSSSSSTSSSSASSTVDRSDTLECGTTVTIEQDPTHRSIGQEPVVDSKKDCHQLVASSSSTPFTSTSSSSSAGRGDKQSAPTTTLSVELNSSSQHTAPSLPPSNNNNNSNMLAAQSIKLEDAQQSIQQLMLAVLNMSQQQQQKSNASSATAAALTLVGGERQVPNTDEDESDSLPDLRLKLGEEDTTVLCKPERDHDEEEAVHDSAAGSEECPQNASICSSVPARRNSSTKSDHANHALAHALAHTPTGQHQQQQAQHQRRRSMAHSTSAGSHDRRHETTNSSHDRTRQQQRAQQQAALLHSRAALGNPRTAALSQHCQSSSPSTRPPQVLPTATDDEQVVPKFSHCMPFDLNGRRNRTLQHSNVSHSTVSNASSVSTTLSGSSPGKHTMRATTPNLMPPTTMDPAFITSYLLSQAQFNQDQSALMSLAQQYQLLESLTRPAKRARLETPIAPVPVEDKTTNNLAAKLLNQLLYAQRPVIAPTAPPAHLVDSPLDLSVKTPSPQPMGSPRSVSPIDSMLLARLHQQQQLIASHEAFKRRSSGSSTLSELTTSLPSTPTTPASLLSQHALHGTIFDPALIFGDQTQLKIETRIDSSRRQRKSQGAKVPQKQVSPSTSPRSELSSDSPSAVNECHACNTCGQTFAFYDRLAKHIASRHRVRNLPNQGLDPTGRAYNCDICNRSFARSDMLTRHMRLHTGIKPYTCGVCQQVFSRSDHLSTHQRTHTGEKPYKCPQCPYAACRRDMITRHMKTHSRYEMPDSSSSAASPLAASPIH